MAEENDLIQPESDETGMPRTFLVTIFYLIIPFNLVFPTLLSLVGCPLSGNGCGSPNHIYIISVLLVILLTQFILNNLTQAS
jgi:hypothetical protein